MSKVNISLYLSMTVLVMAVCNPLRAADEQVHVIPDSELNQWWQAPPGGNSGPQLPPLALDGCIAVAFEIHEDGSVSNERVWHRAWTDTNQGKQFEQAVLQVLPHWHFVPAPANAGHNAVYTYQVFAITMSMISNSMTGTPPMPTASDRRRAERQDDQNKAQCEMSDFPQQVQNMINAAANAKGATQ